MLYLWLSFRHNLTINYIHVSSREAIIVADKVPKEVIHILSTALTLQPINQLESSMNLSYLLIILLNNSLDYLVYHLYI